MLEMNEGRLSFAEILRPPHNYRLSFAVGTTYSLDLRALLGLCIPLGLGFEPEALTGINPVSLFVALKNLQDKLAIYCDKGNIKADIPKSPNSAGLLMLFERMIHQVHVNARRVDGLSSFHPKVWVVEYEGVANGSKLYRLVVMSRNLTFDTSWDVAVALDGHPGDPNECSSHVADFLEFLANGDTLTSTERDDSRRAGSHTARIRKLAKDMRNVVFEVNNKAFTSADFLPLGPVSATEDPRLMDAQKSTLLTSGWRNLLVVSPFLSDGASSPLVTMTKRRPSSGRYVLLSREDSLAKLDPKVRDAFETYCPAPVLSDVDLDGEDGTDASGYSDLHAKLYFCEGYDSYRHLYLGSLNASYNGTVHNVEAMLRLDVRPYQLTFASMLKPLIEGKGKEKPPFSPFVPFEPDECEDDGEHAFSRAFGIASKLISFNSVTVRIGDDGLASLDVSLALDSAKKKCEGITLKFRPLLYTVETTFELENRRSSHVCCFEGISPSQVSGLFVLTGSDGEGHSKSCVLVCPRDKFDDAAMSLERRSSMLLQAITIQNKGALAQYLAHAFDLPEAGYTLSEGSKAYAGGSLARGQILPPGLYERLLDMAYTDPSVFFRATYLMSLLPRDTKQEDIERLRQMVDVFAKAVK